jgi:hypothetical protein
VEGGISMIAWYAIVIVTLLAAGPALAESAGAAFVIGKLFVFNCFDGSRGAVRIYGDGSVIGTIQFQGSGPVRSVWLPAGMLKVKGEAVCASLEGIPIEPCFDLNRTDDQSFRGSLSGLGIAYCDFTHGVSVAGPEPLSLEATPVE